MKLEKNKSIWQEQSSNKFSELIGDKDCEVCVVGAGISGLTIAYTLLKQGKSVIVLDKGQSISGETALTSAHLSTAIDDGYAHLETMHGTEGIQMIAESHLAAIEKIQRIIKEEKIDCDFEWVDGYLIAGKNENEIVLFNELSAAKRAGLKAARLEFSIPYSKKNIGRALKFDCQAQFHAMKYMKGLQKAVEKMGGVIYGKSLVSTTKESDFITVTTDSGNAVYCEYLVFATNTPVNHTIAVHTKESAYRSYVIGLEIPKGSFPKILLWDTLSPYHYVRIQEEKDRDVLIVGGEDHRVGQCERGRNPFNRLDAWVKRKLGIDAKMIYKWSGQIIETVDGLAYIGRSPMSKKIFEVSGDSGHGITHGTIASIIIPDLIMNKGNIWEDLYSPSRITLSAISTYVKENIQGATQNLDWFSPGEVESVAQISKGEGAIIREGVSKIAAYKDTNGKIHKCSAVCPHLGALVRWNSTEKTWDCPFHGSRFSEKGEVINGPSTISLSPIDSNSQNEEKDSNYKQDEKNDFEKL